MARLGEAYVRVRADLKDYDADLDKALKSSTAKFEKALNDATGKKLGNKLGSGLSDGLDEHLRKSTKEFVDNFESSSREAGRRGKKALGESFADKSWLATLAQGFGGLLTDGFSGIPPQLKAAIGGVALAGLAPVGAAISGLIAGSIVAGTAGLGTIFAFQFQEVQDEGKKFTESLRSQLVEATRPFVVPLIQAFDRIDAFIESIGPRLDSIFGTSAGFLAPLTSSLISVIDAVTEGLDYFLEDNQGTVDALSEGIYGIGQAVREVLLIFGDLGEDGEDALRDILYVTAFLLVDFVEFLAVLTDIYGMTRDLATSTNEWAQVLKVFSPLLLLLGIGFGDIDEATKTADQNLRNYEGTTGRYNAAVAGTVTATDAATKALKDEYNAMKKLQEAQEETISLTADWFEGLEDMRKTLSENRNKGGSNEFDFVSKDGRENIKAVSDQLGIARDRTRELYEAGKLNADQAKEFYRQQVEEITALAAKQGISKEQLNGIYGSLLNIIALPPIDNKTANIEGGANNASRAVNHLSKELYALQGIGLPAIASDGSSTAGFRGYASGGIITEPQVATLGEGGRPEVVIPLTDPSRARQLADQSGLMNVLGGDGATTVIVYLGTEQLDARMYRVATSTAVTQARQVAQTSKVM